MHLNREVVTRADRRASPFHRSLWFDITVGLILGGALASPPATLWLALNF